MWPPHLRSPGAGMSAQTRQAKITAGKTLLQEFQRKRGAGGPARLKEPKTPRRGGHPKTDTAGGPAGGGAPREPARPRGAVRAVEGPPGPRQALEAEPSMDRLASEESALRSALAQGQREREQLRGRLAAVTALHQETQEKNQRLAEDLNRVQLLLRQKSRSCEDAEEANAELRGKLEALWRQKSHLKRRMGELQRALEGRAVLRRRLDNLRSLVATFKGQRDSLAADLERERSAWREKVRQLSERLMELGEERERGAKRVPGPESALAALGKQRAGPSQAEQQLQARADRMQEQVKHLEEQLHVQAQQNQSLRLQNLEQQRRLQRAEKEAEEGARCAQDRHRILEAMRHTRVHNQELSQQLAQLRDAFHALSRDKEQLASALTLEKNHLQARLEQQEEQWQEVAARRSQEAEELRELRDQHLAQLRELRAANDQLSQQLSSEKEALQQLLRRPEQVQPKPGDQKPPEHPQDPATCLGATTQQQEELQAPLSFLAFPKDGEGVSDEEETREEATPPAATVPEDVENPRTMRDFYLNALSAAESKRVELSQQLQEQQARCRCLAGLAAQCQTTLEHQALFPRRRHQGARGPGKPGRQGPKEPLEVSLLPDLPDEVPGQSPVEDLQHRCGRLAERLGALEEAILCWKGQMEMLQELYQEKDRCVHRLCQEKEEKKQELQGLLLLLLAGAGPEGPGKMQADAEPRAADAASPSSGPRKTGLRGEQEGFEEVRRLQESPAEHVVLLMPEIQQDQELSGLGSGRSTRFFSRLLQMMRLQ